MKHYRLLMILLLWITGSVFHVADADAPKRGRKRVARDKGARPSLRDRKNASMNRRFGYSIVELKVGDEAPDFEILRLTSIPESGKLDPAKLKPEDKFKLSSSVEKKPVVLIFSSYT